MKLPRPLLIFVYVTADFHVNFWCSLAILFSVFSMGWHFFRMLFSQVVRFNTAMWLEKTARLLLPETVASLAFTLSELHIFCQSDFLQNWFSIMAEGICLEVAIPQHSSISGVYKGHLLLGKKAQRRRDRYCKHCKNQTNRAVHFFWCFLHELVFCASASGKDGVSLCD